MNNLKGIKGIIFDYGSALDISGRNWLHPIHQAYTSLEVAIPKDILQQGLVEIAHQMKSLRESQSSYYYTLKDFFISRAQRQIIWIKENHPHLLEDVSVEEFSHKVARHCYDYSRTNAIAVGNILRELAKKYRLALVSNFNGNLEAILEDFGLKHYFALVTTTPAGEVPKAAQQLFAQTIKSMGMLPRDVLVVGDSIPRDIIPATTLGCRTVWLQNILQTSEPSTISDVLPKSTIRVKNLTELKKMLGV